MKREFLEGLGLPKEQIDAIMAENGNDINKAKSESDALTTQVDEYKALLDQRDKDIAELSKQTGNSAELQTKMADLKAKYEADTQALNDKVAETTRNSAIELELTKVGAKNVRAAKALLDLDKLVVADGSVTGLAEQVKALQESDAYLFGEGSTTQSYTSGGNPSGTGATGVTKEAFDAMNSTARAKLAKEKPEVFKNITGGI